MLKEKKPFEIYEELVATYGVNVMTKCRVYQWCQLFKSGRTSLEDDDRVGRPQTSKSDNNAQRVDALVREDRRLKVREMASILELSKTTVHRLVHDTLGYRKVSARWVPKMLTDAHKLQRLNVSQYLLNLCEADGISVGAPVIGPGGDNGVYIDIDRDFLEHMITGDETWVHHVTPETKRDSMTWKHPGSPPAKKFKVQQSARKLMATVFWDRHGILLMDVLMPGQTVNAINYCETLDKLREAVRRKRPGRLRQGVVLQHDNATPHTANLTKQWMQKYNWTILPHPPHILIWLHPIFTCSAP